MQTQAANIRVCVGWQYLQEQLTAPWSCLLEASQTLNLYKIKRPLYISVPKMVIGEKKERKKEKRNKPPVVSPFPFLKERKAHCTSSSLLFPLQWMLYHPGALSNDVKASFFPGTIVTHLFWYATQSLGQEMHTLLTSAPLPFRSLPYQYGSITQSHGSLGLFLLIQVNPHPYSSSNIINCSVNTVMDLCLGREIRKTATYPNNWFKRVLWFAEQVQCLLVEPPFFLALWS